MTSTSTREIIIAIKATGQDNEFYPTTNEIIREIAVDIKRDCTEWKTRSLLDIGAGNGKVLETLSSFGDLFTLEPLYAIESSQILLGELDPKIFVIGTDFHEQSLLSQKVDITFCNPPYSEFEAWAEKIIRQSASSTVYLVIPQRWKNSDAIADALKFRSGTCKVLGSYSFQNSEDRQARAEVDLLKITLSDEENDSFVRFFDEQFAGLKARFKTPNAEKGPETSPFSTLVIGPNYPEALCSLYQEEMGKIERNYRIVGELDAQLLTELDVDPQKIMLGLKNRLEGLKQKYWHELFSHLAAITDRLTHKSRKTLLQTLHTNVHVDFTLGNIYAIIIWVIKNTNQFIDLQLVETYEEMVDKANVQLYKSNQKTWVQDHWRYNQKEENTHYSLDYRIVTHRVGGYDTRYSWDKGLSERAAIFIGDLLTLAKNLGFHCQTNPDNLSRSSRSVWIPGKSMDYVFQKDEKDVVLFDVKAFQNGNIHLRLNKNFIRKLNVEFGRLKGWLRSPQEAAEELQQPKAAEDFKSNHRICLENPGLLLCEVNSTASA